MTLTLQMFLIVCPMLFLAGLVDAIGGGGGLISLPAYLLAGLPVHQSIATNKLSSTCGTALTTIRFIRQGLVNWKISLPAIVYVSATMRGTYPSLPALCFSLFIGMLLIFMHRSNIRRLFNGNENKLTFKKKQK